jgi:hypothetical protein
MLIYCVEAENPNDVISNKRIVFKGDLNEGNEEERRRKKKLRKLKKATKKEKVIETKSTKFNVVTPKDLTNQKYVNSEAWNFKEKMLYGNRLEREDHKQKKLNWIKKKASNEHLCDWVFRPEQNPTGISLRR